MSERGSPPTAPSSAEIRQRLVEITQARLEGRLDQVVAHFAPDVIVHYNCTKEGLYAPGIMYGRGSFLASLKRAEEEYQPLEGEIVEILVENCNAALRWRTRWRHRGNGRLWSLEMAYLLRWRRAQIVEMHEFFDAPSPSIVRFTPYRSLDAILNPPASGLTREEMIGCAEELAAYAVDPRPDPDVIRRHCAPDIVCEFVGDRARIPYAGRHIGVAALVSIITTINIDFKQTNLGLSSVIVDGGKFACRRTVEWRHRGTGRRGTVELAYFLRFENGLLVEFMEYRDSVTILEMQGELEHW
jgi:ketosteroid isomerase-like protein